jgi:hypothetical protein
MNLEDKIIRALEWKSLAQEELAASVGGTSLDVNELDRVLYILANQKYWIQHHGVIGSGCKSCACSVSYVWRLTRAGRDALNEQRKQGKE